MTVHMLRFTATPEAVPDVERAMQALVAELAEAAPEGVHAAYHRVADTPEFVALLHLADGAPNPLPTLPAARRFQSGLATWADAPATPVPLTPVASYPT